MFRLFPTKEELFAAVTRESSRRMMTAFRDAAAEARQEGSDPLDVMGRAYDELLERDRDVLLVQLHARGGREPEPLVREAIQDCFKAVYELVKRESGAGRDEIQAWFAHGMLCNVTAAIGDRPARRGVGQGPLPLGGTRGRGLGRGFASGGRRAALS